MRTQPRSSRTTTLTSEQKNQTLRLFFTPKLVLIDSGALDSSGLSNLYQILCILLVVVKPFVHYFPYHSCRPAYSLLAFLVGVIYLYFVDRFWAGSPSFLIMRWMLCISELLVIITKFIAYPVTLVPCPYCDPALSWRRNTFRCRKQGQPIWLPLAPDPEDLSLD